MNFLWVIFALFFATIAQAKTITCHQSNSGIDLEIDGIYFLKITEKSACGFSFWLVKNIDGRSSWAVFAGPAEKDFGPNAQNALYIKPSKSNKFQYAGNLPVDAENISNGKYKHVRQEGGGIYSNYYLIRKGKIILLSKSKTLLVDGKYCVTASGLVNLSDLKQNAICEMKIEATFDNPICTITEKNKTNQEPRDQCFDLEIKNK